MREGTGDKGHRRGCSLLVAFFLFSSYCFGSNASGNGSLGAAANSTEGQGSVDVKAQQQPPLASGQQYTDGAEGLQGPSQLSEVPGAVGISLESEPVGSAILEEQLDRPETAVPSVEVVEDDRHNFALAKDGAKVIAANKEAKKAGALLDSDGDTYLKNECKAEKWIIVELSQLIKMDTLAFSQNELYSSRIKEFEAKGRQTHPRLEGTEYSKNLNSSSWQMVGRFNASNTKGSQVFKLEAPVWVKYLQLRMLSHHGAEAVCALNDLCVYGKSAAEDLEDRLSSEPDLEEEIQPGTQSQQPQAGPPPLEPLAEPAITVESDMTSAADLGSNKQGASESPDVEQEPKVTSPVEDGQGGAKIGAQAGPQSADLHNAQQRPPVIAAESEESPVKKQQHSTGASQLKDTDSKQEDRVPKQPLPPGPAEGMPGAASTPEPAEIGLPEPAQNETSSPPAAPDTAPASAPEPPPGPLKEPVGTNVDSELPTNSASSSASRHGGNMYDRLVQELRSTRLAQKNVTRLLEDLRRNVTAVLGSFAFDLDMLAMRLNILHPPMPALTDASEASCTAKKPHDNGTCDVSTVSGNFGQQAAEVLLPPSDFEVLQAELADLKELVGMQNEQIQKLVVMPLFVLCGCLGLSFIYLVCCLPPSRTSFVLMTTGCCIIGWLLRTYSDHVLTKE